MSDGFEEFRAAGDVAAAPAEFGFVAEDNFEFAVEPGLEFADGVESNDGTAIDAGEEFGVEGGFDGVERGAHGVGFYGGVDGEIVAVGLDPGNFADVDEIGASVFADEQAFGKSAIAEDLVDQRAEMLFAGATVWRDLKLCVVIESAAEDLTKADVGNWLEQVVEGVNFESTDGVVIVGSNEDKAWDCRSGTGFRIRGSLVCGDGADNVEAVGARHLHVEKNKVWLVMLDGGDGGSGVVGFGDDFDFRLGAEKAEDFAARRRFVVDYQDFQRCWI